MRGYDRALGEVRIRFKDVVHQASHAPASLLVTANTVANHADDLVMVDALRFDGVNVTGTEQVQLDVGHDALQNYGMPIDVSTGPSPTVLRQPLPRGLAPAQIDFPEYLASSAPALGHYGFGIPGFTSAPASRPPARFCRLGGRCTPPFW